MTQTQRGDLITALPLFNAAGQQFDPTAQAFAGRPLLLFFRTMVPDAAALSQFAALRAAAADASAAAFLVVSGHTAVSTDDSLLWDADGGVARSFGVGDAGFVVIGPGGQFVEVLAGPEGADPLALCRTLFVDRPVLEITRQAPVLLVPDVLNAEQSERLIAYWQGKDKTDDRVANTEYGHQHEKATVKRRSDVVVADRGIFEMMKMRLAKTVVPAVGRGFQRKIAGFEAVRIGCYDSAAGGHFARHRDNTTPYTMHRQFAVSLNLNDAYEGGQLRFPEFGQTVYRPRIGEAVVFSCSLMHEALPVTAGRRLAVFTFLFDAAGAERERQLQEKLKAQGEGIEAES